MNTPNTIFSIQAKSGKTVKAACSKDVLIQLDRAIESLMQGDSPSAFEVGALSDSNTPGAVLMSIQMDGMVTFSIEENGALNKAHTQKHIAVVYKAFVFACLHQERCLHTGEEPYQIVMADIWPENAISLTSITSDKLISVKGQDDLQAHLKANKKGLLHSLYLCARPSWVSLPVALEALSLWGVINERTNSPEDADEGMGGFISERCLDSSDQDFESQCLEASAWHYYWLSINGRSEFHL